MDHPTRFQDTLACLCSFTEREVHVVCPGCRARAVVAPISRPACFSRRWPRRLVCTECTFTREQSLIISGRRHHVDEASFGAPLWLQTSCRRHTLWALNSEHLDYLERYISAVLRERGNIRGTLSMVESLPAWIQRAAHRDDVLRGIVTLRARLPVADLP